MFNKTALILAAAGLMVCGCNRTPSNDGSTGSKSSNTNTTSPSRGMSTTQTPSTRRDTQVPTNVTPTPATTSAPVTTPVVPGGPDPAGMQPGAARDAAITEQVKRLIENDKAISEEARKIVAVMTRDGMVTLTGTVPLQTDKDIIEAKVGALPAVGRVENKIVVSGTPKAP